MGAFLLLTSKARAWWESFKENNQEDDFSEDDASPFFTNPLVRWSGQPGQGKTFDMSRAGLYGGYYYRLPTFVQDAKGDIAIYRNRIIATLEKRKDKASLKKLDYLKNKVRISNRSDGGDLKATVDHVFNKMAGKSQKYPTINLIVDEGGALQFDNEQSFWNIASTFRNIGANCHVTTHREGGDGGIGPLGREATRAVVIYSQYSMTEFFGIKVEQFSKALSTEKVYIDCVDRKFKKFHLPESDKPIKPGMIPEVIIHPVNATRIENMAI